MTAGQRYRFSEIMREQSSALLHHGDCIGADAQAHSIAREYNRPVTIHPPDDDSKRAFCEGASSIREPKPYLARNKDIVTETEWLIATPKGYSEELRSGTWATIREARRQKKPITIIWPDGRATADA